MLPKAIFLSVVCAVLCTPKAHGDVIFGLGELDLPVLVSVGAYNQTSATTAIGTSLNDSSSILFVTTDTELFIPSAGAARIEAVSTPFQTLVYQPIGNNWLGIELNPQIASGGSAGTFFLQALDQNGDVFTSSTFALVGGQNRVWASAISGQQITQLSLTASGSIVNDVRQVRISAVPEPNVFGLGMGVVAVIGSMVRRRR